MDEVIFFISYFFAILQHHMMQLFQAWNASIGKSSCSVQSDQNMFINCLIHLSYSFSIVFYLPISQ